MRIALKHLRKLVSEEMMPGPTGTPDQTLSTANNKSDDAGFTQMQKAAIGFMNNSMGTSPSSDQLDGMHSELNNYAQQKGVSPAGLKSSLQKILPSSSTHPDYQYDSGSGAVSSSDGRKIYGEMKITKRQLRRIIKEEKKLLEYERHVDKDGNIYDDEGNVERRGSSFGSRYGGETYAGTSAPWDNKRSNTGGPDNNSANSNLKKAIETSLTSKSNNFLKSILDQMIAGKTLSSKQMSVVEKILVKQDPATASLFKEGKMKITKRQLRRIINEEAIRLIEQGAKKGPYGYEGADSAIYDEAYDRIMDVMSEFSLPGRDSTPDPRVHAALYNALTAVAKELELEMKSGKV